MNIIKSTAGRGGLQSAKAFFKDSTFLPQVMTRLIIVFVSREEWNTATTVIETNYEAANLIPISLVESCNFWCRLYHSEPKRSLLYGDRKKINSIFNFVFTGKYSALSVPLTLFRLGHFGKI